MKHELVLNEKVMESGVEWRPGRDLPTLGSDEVDWVPVTHGTFPEDMRLPTVDPDLADCVPDDRGHRDGRTTRRNVA